MNDVTLVRDALADSLEGVDPAPFGDRIESVLGGQTPTLAVLTVRAARALDPAVEARDSAHRGVGVQLSYEGLRLTREILRTEAWDERDDAEDYYVDLLAAGTIVSRGFQHLATSGVSDQAVDIVRRFGRVRTLEQTGTPDPDANSLEFDAIALAVEAGADLALESVPPAVSALGETLAAELEAEPLPDPAALDGVEERFGTVLNPAQND